MAKAFTPKEVLGIMVDSNPKTIANWYIEQINSMIATEDYKRSNMSIDLFALLPTTEREPTILLNITFLQNNKRRWSEALYTEIATKLKEAGWTDVTIDLVENKINCKATTNAYGLEGFIDKSTRVNKLDSNHMANLAELNMGASESEEISNAITRLGTASAASENNKIKVNSDKPFNRGAGINPFYHSKNK